MLPSRRGAAQGLDLRGAAHFVAAGIDLELDRDPRDRQRVAQRDQLGRALAAWIAAMRATPSTSPSSRCHSRSASASPAACGSRAGNATRCVSAWPRRRHVRLAVRVEVCSAELMARNSLETFVRHDSHRSSRASPLSTPIQRRAWRVRLAATICAGAQLLAPVYARTNCRCWRPGLRRLQHRHRTQARRRDHARDPRRPDYSTTRCCSSTCSRCGSRGGAGALARHISSDIDQRLAWTLLVRDKEVNAFALPAASWASISA